MLPREIVIEENLMQRLLIFFFPCESLASPFNFMLKKNIKIFQDKTVDC